MSNKSYLTIFVEKSKLVFVDPAVAEKQEFKFPKELIHDLEIVDEKKLKVSLADFIKTAGIKTKKVVIVFSKSTYLVKKIAQADFTKKSEIIESFSDLVPFEDIFVRELRVDKELRAVVVNRNFYEPILNVLSELKFKLDSIFPEFAILESIGKYSYDRSSANNIIKSLGKLSNLNLLNVSNQVRAKNLGSDSGGQKNGRGLGSNGGSLENRLSEKSYNLKYLIPALVVLILLMVGVLMSSSNRKKEKLAEAEQRSDKIRQEQQLLKERAEAKTEESLTKKEGLQFGTKDEGDQASESAKVEDAAVVDLSEHKLRVLNGSGISGQGAKMKTAFEALGFEEVDIGNAKINESGETLVIFVAGLPAQVKDLVIEEVKDLELDYKIQESAELSYAAVITTAKP